MLSSQTNRLRVAQNLLPQDTAVLNARLAQITAAYELGWVTTMPVRDTPLAAQPRGAQLKVLTVMVKLRPLSGSGTGGAGRRRRCWSRTPRSTATCARRSP